MYAVSVSRTFVAQHALTVPDPGPEGTVHSHRYTVEATVSGADGYERDRLECRTTDSHTVYWKSFPARPRTVLRSHR